jgi:predicted DNA-binding ribbon-helix-helix protein
MSTENPAVIQRVQTGIRIEKRTLKVLKAVAELKDLTVGDLLEGILLHVYEGQLPFGKDTLDQIGNLKRVYGLTLTAKNSHRLREASK